MDHLHARLTRLGLETAANRGFVLAGGYAVQAHGFLQRISGDPAPTKATKATTTLRRASEIMAQIGLLRAGEEPARFAEA